MAEPERQGSGVRGQSTERHVDVLESYIHTYTHTRRIEIIKPDVDRLKHTKTRQQRG